MRNLLLITAIVLASLAAACGDDEPSPPTPTGAPAATSTPGFPPVDGTVDPLGFGGTDPVTLKANPDPPRKTAILKDVRIGAHPELGGWDRIVFEFQDDFPPGELSYIKEAISCGQGAPVAVRGSAVLSLRLTTVQAHDDAGNLTIKATTVPGPGNAILEAKEYCDFEGHVNWAIGVKTQNRFKVVRLSNPTRLVIDIKW